MTLPTTFSERVQAKINESIGELLPPEDIKRLVDAQIAEFQRVDLPKLVKAEIEAKMRQQIKDEIDSPAFNQQWEGNGFGAADLVKKIMVESADEIFAAMFSSMAQMVVNNMRNARMI